jgi:transcriptional regulator with XRE-family HTH domain
MDEKGRQKFGEYLRSLRVGKKISQKSAAEQAEISAPYLAQVENGQRNPPSRSKLSKLAKVYGVAPQEVWQEAEFAETNQKALYKSLDPSRIQWAFQAMLEDPSYSFGTRVRGQELTIQAKAMLVEIYQKSMGRQLLTPEELELGAPEGRSNDESDSASGDSEAGN